MKTLLKVIAGLVALVLLILLLLYLGVQLSDGKILTPSAEDWQPTPAAAPAAPAAKQEPCESVHPHRRAFFGDLHVHTHLSFDAGSRAMRLTADEAYRFARGEEVLLGPWDENGVGSRPRQLSTPLDFAAVTDHAEWIGELMVCSNEEYPGYQSEACQEFRRLQQLHDMMSFRAIAGTSKRHPDVCGEDASECREALLNGWRDNQRIAEKHNNPGGGCEFTTFHGYEYTNNGGMSKVHRNVIFRNERVIELPISSLEQDDIRDVWQRLDELCNHAEGDCQAITIPHNPNASSGKIFTIPWRDEPEAEQRRQAAQRARLEPVVEMMQVKGESECRQGMWNVLGEDEWCDFEKQRGYATTGDTVPADCEGSTSHGAIGGVGCQSRLDFARYALVEGMVEQQRIGVNPYRFGMAGSTDTHNGTPGDVAEVPHEGCCSNNDNRIEQRLAPSNNFAGKPASYRNPGGLIGIWAEENSREALFEGMLRREVFSTSGPRIQPRFFAGTEIPMAICDGDIAATGDRHGVTMGGVLPPSQRSPVFAAAAVADPEGGGLQRLQLIKVWPGEGDEFHQQVVDLAVSASDTTLDLNTCAVSGDAARQLCGTWSDPDFDANLKACADVRD